MKRIRSSSKPAVPVAASCVLTTLAVALSAAAPSTAGAEPYQDAVLATNPMAYWPLDEAGGAVADATGNGHHGAAEGSPGYGAPSLLPGGAGSAISLSHGSRFAVDAFEKWNAGSTGYTVAYWIQFDNAVSTYTQVLGDGVGTFYMMSYLQNDGAGVCPRPHYGAVNSGYDPSPCTLGAYLTPGAPHQVVISWDRALGQAHTWIDGVEFIQTGKPTGVPTNTDLRLWIGHDDREAGWSMTLDEPAFWDRPLTAAEVQSLAEAAAVTDSDGDGVYDDDDVCALGDDLEDFDADSVPDACDNCPTSANSDQSDADGNGTGDACDDPDGDGVLGFGDNCPFVSNPDQGDSDSDGDGDACDADDDDDGVLDDSDNCSLVPNGDQSDWDADGDGDACDGDSDADGAADADEPASCLSTPLNVPVSEDGCSGAQHVEVTCGVCSDHATRGGFVSCVSDATNDARSNGLLSGKEKASIVRVAARSCK